MTLQRAWETTSAKRRVLLPNNLFFRLLASLEPGEGTLSQSDYDAWQLVSTAPIVVSFDDARRALARHGGDANLAFASLFDD